MPLEAAHKTVRGDFKYTFIIFKPFKLYIGYVLLYNIQAIQVIYLHAVISIHISNHAN